MGRRATNYKRKVGQFLRKHGVKSVGEVTGRVGSAGTERKVALMARWAEAAGATRK